MANTTLNLNSHYTTTPTVNNPQLIVVTAPEEIPIRHVFSDRDANLKLKQLNQDIYKDSQKAKNKDVIKIFKWLGGITIAILAIFGAKHFFK